MSHVPGRAVEGRRVIVFARAPEPGRVKSRLAAGVRATSALRIYRWLAERTVAAMRRVPACTLEIHYTPPDAERVIRDWLGGDIDLRPQAGGDLGDRMRAAVANAVADGAGAVVLVGTDCPALDAALVERAFAGLEHADVVLGPATDGGYYLIALRAPHAALFDGIPWSAPDTLARTLDAARAAGLRAALLDEHADIDTLDDWRRWRAGRALHDDDRPAAPRDEALGDARSPG